MSKKNRKGSPILVVDDEAHVLAALKASLLSGGFTSVATCQDSRDVLGRLAREPTLCAWNRAFEAAASRPEEAEAKHR